MKKMFFSILFCSLILSPSGNLLGQQRDIKAILKRDIVKVENGIYSIQEYGTIAAFGENFELKEFQVKVNAKGPVALLSRDNFLRFYGAFSSSIFATFLTEEGLKAPADLHILLKDKAGDPIDLTVDIVMSADGVDYTVTAKNRKSMMNLHWLTQLYQEIER